MPTQLELFLDAAGCAICAHLAEAERSFFAWFAIESFGAVEVRARVRAAMGMCPAHLRLLLDRHSGGHVVNSVMRDAVGGALDRLRGDVDAGPCPACAAKAAAVARASRVLADGLADAANARGYAEHRGVCLPHFLALAELADDRALTVLADRLLATLQGPSESAVDVIAGPDADAHRRAGPRRRLPPLSGTGSTIEALDQRLSVDACPVCLSAGSAESRYLEWLVAATRAGDQSIERDPGGLCPRHLHDTLVADVGRGCEAVDRECAARSSELRRLLDRLASVSGRGRRAHRRDAGDVRDEMLADRYCSACHARSGVENSQLGLVEVALALAGLRDRYLRSHGLCARHALALAQGNAADLAIEHAGARLGVLGWELGENTRKQAWACRHEAPGPEADAWLRAAAQIDGRIFEGAPPPRQPLPEPVGRP